MLRYVAGASLLAGSCYLGYTYAHRLRFNEASSQDTSSNCLKEFIKESPSRVVTKCAK